MARDKAFNLHAASWAFIFTVNHYEFHGACETEAVYTWRGHLIPDMFQANCARLKHLRSFHCTHNRFQTANLGVFGFESLLIFTERGHKTTHIQFLSIRILEIIFA